MMPGWTQILIVVVLLVLLFGRGKISELMGDVAKGIKSFKKGITEDEAEAKPVKSIKHDASNTIDAAKTTTQEKTETS